MGKYLTQILKQTILYALILSAGFAYSQNFGNEWVNYNQKYYKIGVIAKGIYRINYANLVAAGVPVGEIDPVYLQLFYKGREQYIYVNGESDRSLDAQDYIEFYGEPNDGWLDSVFYLNPSQQVNPKFSMITDTAWYFLTWSSSSIPKRLTIENDLNFNSYPKLDYFIREVRANYTTYYNYAAEGAYFNDGEGWTDAMFDYNVSSPKTLQTPDYVNKSQKSTVSYCIVGANSTGHRFRVSGLGLAIDTIFSGYQTIRRSIQTSTAIPSSSTITAKSTSSSTDNNAWAWLSVRYTHAMSFEKAASLSFTLPAIAASKYRLTLANFSGDDKALLYDLTNHKRISPTLVNDTLRLLLKNEGNSPECFLSSGSEIKTPAAIQPISSKNSDPAYFADFSSLKVSYIIVTNKQLWTKAKEYADYRKTTHGNVLLLDVDELYNQFGYGINKHPAAIRNFCRYALSKSLVTPEYLFFIGKSIHSRDCRFNVTNSAKNLVPSAGMPVSDALFTWKLGSGYAPVIATGRIAAQSLSDVDLYLSKVKEYENAKPAAWMKNVLQFSGGRDISERSIMKNYILNYQRILSDTLLGARVQNFFKNSSLPIETTQADLLSQYINNGVCLLNFFGHGASTELEQNISLPSTYENKGKYPFLLASSCASGDINNADTKGISEQWVLIKDKGTIGFLANVDVGYAFYLNLFSEEFIKNIASFNYNGAVGKSIINSIKTNEKKYSNSDYMRFTSLDMMLHCDPAIKIYGFDKPDLAADEKYITFTPSRLTTDIDSFQVHLQLVNNGRAFKDSFLVSVKQTFPNGKTNTLKLYVKGVASEDTITFTLPIGGINNSGMNKLEIKLDANDTILELNEANNSMSHSFVVNSTELIPVYPYKFAIYPYDTAVFIASSPDPYLNTKTALFQIDVTAKFNSTSLKQVTGTSVNGLFRAQFPFKFTPNQVYYWRVAVDKNDGNPRWNASSFIYVPGKTGWSQADFEQFPEDTYQYMSWNEPQKNFSYVHSSSRLNCSTIGITSADFNDITKLKKTQYSMDGILIDWSSCGTDPAFNVVVLDSASLQGWNTNKGNFGHVNYPFCSSAKNVTQHYFMFRSDVSSNRLSMAKFLTDSVPDDDYILVYTWVSGNFSSMEQKVIEAFEALGAKQIRNLTQQGGLNNIPYIFFVKKGHPETVREVVSSSFNTLAELNVDLTTNYIEGNIGSTIIGPSRRWSQFKQSVPKTDNFDVNSFAITAINTKSQELQALKKIQTDIDTLHKVIRASLYPYLKLTFNTADKINRTPGQLKTWQVYYDEYAEGAIVLTPATKFYKDTLQEGDTMRMTIAFQNISSNPMDSVMVTYTITNSKNELIKTITKRFSALLPEAIITDSISFATTGYSGTNLITVEFNPFNPAKGTYDQLEQYHFNNIAQRYFHVVKDKRNPLFDVTFDGIHIMNGDIVSAKPEIKISLKDENTYFLMDDTSLVEIYLKKINENQEKRIYFGVSSESALTFSPGTSKNNKAVIQYNPVFTADGLYQLRIKGRDKSGNQSGTNDYVISFEVITKSTITNLINYPNPFTTATRFVFTLTGSEIPSDLRIQIFTISGKMVKEISLTDLGNLHIGRNITQYAWDGTDNYGDKLANGVYLYRVFSSISSKAIEHRSSEVDQYIKKGFGKMYLMR